MQSFSTSGRSGVQTFFDFEMDVQRLRGEVRERVERIRTELPEDVERIDVVNFSTDDTPILGVRIASERNLQTAYEFLDLKLKRRIERVPGVAEVELFGTQRPEIGVYLSLDELRRYRVDAGRLFRNLSDINLDRSLGRFTDGGVRYGAMTRGMFRSMEDFKLFPVNERGLVLENVANVVYESPVAHASQHLNGEYAVGLWVRKAAEANTVTTVRGVEAELETIRSDPALQGIQLDVIRNAGAEIVKALTGLLTAGTLGALLALGVLVLFLRKWSAALVVALAIPLSLVGSLGFLYFGGLSLNVLSMMGLMLATGMLVDNAIVVLESIYRNLEQGADRLQAVKQGTQEVQMAVIAATLTSIIIFVPLVFGAQSFLSFWLRHCGLAIIFSLLCSLFLSLTLIPLAMGRFLKLDVAPASGTGHVPAAGGGGAPAAGDGRMPGRRRNHGFLPETGGLALEASLPGGFPHGSAVGRRFNLAASQCGPRQRAGRAGAGQPPDQLRIHRKLSLRQDRKGLRRSGRILPGGEQGGLQDRPGFQLLLQQQCIDRNISPRRPGQPGRDGGDPPEDLGRPPGDPGLPDRVVRPEWQAEPGRDQREPLRR